MQNAATSSSINRIRGSNDTNIRTKQATNQKHPHASHIFYGVRNL